jgi:hypothetical protein
MPPPIFCLEADPAEQFKEFAMAPVSYIYHQALRRRPVMQHVEVLACPSQTAVFCYFIRFYPKCALVQRIDQKRSIPPLDREFKENL